MPTTGLHLPCDLSFHTANPFICLATHNSNTTTNNTTRFDKMYYPDVGVYRMIFKGYTEDSEGSPIQVTHKFSIVANKPDSIDVAMVGLYLAARTRDYPMVSFQLVPCLGRRPHQPRLASDTHARIQRQGIDSTADPG